MLPELHPFVVWKSENRYVFAVVGEETKLSSLRTSALREINYTA